MSLTRLIPGLWSSPSGVIPQSGNANAVAIGEPSEVWALVDTRLQKWTMSLEGWEEVIFDEDLAGIVAPAVRDAFYTVPEDSLDLELLDLAIERYDKVMQFLLWHTE
jgi:nuclear pore complex protein Nup133